MSATEEQLVHIRNLLQLNRFRFASEAELQRGIGSVLQQRFEVEREVRLTKTDRIDFVIDRIGIEVKIGGSLGQVTSQLHRYAQCPELDAVLLVTTRAKHAAQPATMNGKPVRVYWMRSL